MLKEVQCGLKTVRVMDLGCGFLGWAGGGVGYRLHEEEGGIIPYFRRLFSSLYYNTRRLSCGPLQLTEPFPPMQERNSQKHNQRPWSPLNPPQFLLKTSPDQTQFLLWPLRLSSDKPLVSCLSLRPFLCLGLGEQVGTSLRARASQPFLGRGPPLCAVRSNLARAPKMSVALKSLLLGAANLRSGHSLELQIPRVDSAAFLRPLKSFLPPATWKPDRQGPFLGGEQKRS